MPPTGKLLAWIEQRGDDEFLGAFIGAHGAQKVPTRRAPATQLCSSSVDATQWVDDQAAALGLPVEWLDSEPVR